MRTVLTWSRATVRATFCFNGGSGAVTAAAGNMALFLPKFVQLPTWSLSMFLLDPEIIFWEGKSFVKNPQHFLKMISLIVFSFTTLLGRWYHSTNHRWWFKNHFVGPKRHALTACVSVPERVQRCYTLKRNDRYLDKEKEGHIFSTGSVCGRACLDRGTGKRNCFVIDREHIFDQR